MRKAILLCILFLAIFPLNSFAEDEAIEDGTYDATVTTNSGSYTVPVEVEDGEVTYVHWPNGGDMHVYGGDIEDGSASGANSRGDSVDIEIEE